MSEKKDKGVRQPGPLPADRKVYSETDKKSRGDTVSNTRPPRPPVDKGGKKK